LKAYADKLPAATVAPPRKRLPQRQRAHETETANA
jgi:hypothetical protein